MRNGILDHVRIISNFLTDTTPTEDLPKSDAIFCFGQAIFRQVPEFAVELYRLGISPRVVVTGGRSPYSAESEKCEAEIFFDALTAGGVPPEKIIIEKNSSNTLENVIFGMQALVNAGIRPRKLTLCAVPLHLRRARATFSKQFPNVKTYGGAFPIEQSDLLTEKWYSRIVGEVDRLQDYAVRGDISQVEIPKEVLIACDIVRSEYSSR